MENPKIKELSLALAQAKVEEALIKDKISKLRDELYPLMLESGVKDLETPFGKFAITYDKVWTYPTAISVMESNYLAQKAELDKVAEAVKIAQIDAQKSGAATAVVTGSDYRFTKSKAL